MTTTIDFRETDLIALLPSGVSGPLDIGDIYCKSTTGNLEILIERKKLADLDASVKDGRYREQKARLCSWVAGAPAEVKRRVCYIIECAAGAWEKNIICRRAILGTQIRDKIALFITDGPKETVALVTEIMEKIDTWADEPMPTDFDYTNLLVAKKKKNITKSAVFIQGLKIIPGLSDGAANAIAAVYPDRESLAAALKQPNAAKLIAELKTASGRKVGPALAKKIIELW